MCAQSVKLPFYSSVIYIFWHIRAAFPVHVVLW